MFNICMRRERKGSKEERGKDSLTNLYLIFDSFGNFKLKMHICTCEYYTLLTIRDMCKMYSNVKNTNK